MTDNLPTPAPQDRGEIILYQTEDGLARIEVRLEGETVWLSLSQMAQLFQRDKSVISRHIANLFEEGELRRDSVVAVYATTAADEKTYQVEYYLALKGAEEAKKEAARHQPVVDHWMKIGRRHHQW